VSDDLDEQLRGLDAPMTPPPMGDALEAAVAGAKPVAPRRPARQWLLLLAVSLGYAGALLGIMHARVDCGELPIAWLVGAGAAWLAGFAVPVYLATVPRAGDVTPRWSLAAAAAIVCAVGFVALGLLVHPHGPDTADAPTLWAGRACLGIGVATSIVPVALGALFLRRTLPVGARWCAAALGAGGGSLGGFVLHLHCHVGNATHVGIMHGGAVVVSALVAALVVGPAAELK
jgi:hypothetical protein